MVCSDANHQTSACRQALPPCSQPETAFEEVDNDTHRAVHVRPASQYAPQPASARTLLGHRRFIRDLFGPIKIAICRTAIRMLCPMAMSRPLVILQVEDAPTDVQLTAYALKARDIPLSLHVVTDGALAVEFLKHSGTYNKSPRPDLILLDLDLPKLDGSQVLEFIKGNDVLKTIP